MKAEVDMRSTGPDETEEACTRSLMRLRFSVTGGAEYYNDETPRTAIAVECALPTPHTPTLVDTVVRSTPLVKRTAVVEEERGIDARTSSARPTQCLPEYAPASDYCYSKQNANAVDYCWFPESAGNQSHADWTLAPAHGDNNCGLMCNYIWEYRAHTSDHCWKDTRNAGKYCWSPTIQNTPVPVIQWERSYDNGDNNCGQLCTIINEYTCADAEGNYDPYKCGSVSF